MRGPKNREPLTLLQVVKKGYLQQIRFLVDQGVNLNQKDEDRKTTLMLCAFLEPEQWGFGIARLFIEHGAKLDCSDRFGLTAFHYACIYERVDLVKVYLKAIDFDLNAGDKEGNTGLHFAVRAGNVIIVRLIAQCYVKYKISFDKENKAGCTPLDEAYKLDNKRIIRILECPEAFTDSGNIEGHLPLDLKTEFDETVSLRSSSRKTFSRPRSSMFSRRTSKCSTMSSELFFRRSPTIYNYELKPHQLRALGRIAKPTERDETKLIHCVSLSDFRNNPEHLFNIKPEDAMTVVEASQRRQPKPRAKSAFVRRSEVESDYGGHSFSWRTEFRKLYFHYQYQHTMSYCTTAKPPDDQFLPNLDKSPTTPVPSEDGLDEDGRRRGRKGAYSRQTTRESLTPSAKGRQPHAVPSKSRKLGHLKSEGLESSSESLNSSVSSKKHSDDKPQKGAKDKKDDATSGGRLSRAANHKNNMDTSAGNDLSDEASRLKRIIE